MYKKEGFSQQQQDDVGGEPDGGGDEGQQQHKVQVARSTSNRSATLPSSQVKEKKLGHRRVRNDGEVTYKKFQTTQLIGSIQLGIQHSVGGLASVPEDRDLLMQDFMSIETVSFTRDGLLQKTPAHNYSEFRFRTYASFAFRRFRKLFHIETELYLASICSEPMIELSNPGVSGSIFYVTSDDNFICKTVQHKEAEFLQKISLGYYLNLEQNQRTLLPKFFGLHCYSCNAKNVRIVVMNNLFPSQLKMHHKFDLKGSTYKRKANRQEREKASPTFKDLDFNDLYPEGILLHGDIYTSLMNSIQRDCIVLESFKIMDYSLLIGIHNLDHGAADGSSGDCCASGGGDDGSSQFDRQGSVVHRERMIAHSTALESITMTQPAAAAATMTTDVDQVDAVNNVWGGIPAKNQRGENLLLFIGIIDILQSYGMLKKVEHYWKSLIHDGDTVSVHRPGFYAARFQSFMKDKVFKKLQQVVTLPATAAAAIKTSSSFRKANVQRTLSSSVAADNQITAAVGPPTRGLKDDAAVTVITIDNSAGVAVNVSTDQVFLPPVLQDRKPKTGGVWKRVDEPSSHSSTLTTIVPSSPLSTMQRNLLHKSLDDRNAETGSIITMTSDERVQIFVPSPSGGGTPYSTITRMSSEREEFASYVTMASSRPQSTGISWHETSPTKAKSSSSTIELVDLVASRATDKDVAADGDGAEQPLSLSDIRLVDEGESLSTKT